MVRQPWSFCVPPGCCMQRAPGTPTCMRLLRGAGTIVRISLRHLFPAQSVALRSGALCPVPGALRNTERVVVLLSSSCSAYCMSRPIAGAVGAPTAAS